MASLHSIPPLCTPPPIALHTLFLHLYVLAMRFCHPTSFSHSFILFGALITSTEAWLGMVKPARRRSTSCTTSLRPASARPGFQSTKENTESETTATVEDVKPYVIARGDGSTGGGGLPMPKRKQLQDDQDHLRRPKVGAPMPDGRPAWFKVPAPSQSDESRYANVKNSLQNLDLHTVCEEAREWSMSLVRQCYCYCI